MRRFKDYQACVYALEEEAIEAMYQQYLKEKKGNIEIKMTKRNNTFDFKSQNKGC